MAITRTGSLTEIQSSANASSSGITVPSDAELIVVGVSGYESGVQLFTNGGMTLNSVALSEVIGDSNDSAFKGGLFYLVNPATGSQTLAWDWAGTSAITMGVIFVYGFFKGVDTSALLRDSEASQAASEPFSTSTLTAQSGDYIVGWSWMFVGTPPTVTWTNATKQADYGDFSFAGGSWAEASPSGNVALTANWDATADGGIAALVLKPSGGGGGGLSIPVAMHSYRRRRAA